MKRIKVYEILSTIEKVNSIKNKEFAWFIARNKTIFLREKERIETKLNRVSVEQEKELNIYNSKRIELIETHSQRDSKNYPIKDDKGNYSIIKEEVEILVKELNNLSEEYKEILDLIKEIDNKNNKLLEEEIEIEPYFIDYDKIPEEIDAETLFIFMDLIKK